MTSLRRSIWRSACFAAAVVGCGATQTLAADTAGGVANWFETVAEAERLAEAEAGKPQTPPASPPPAPAPVPSLGASEQPPRPAVVMPHAQAINPDDLRPLIDKRNKLVNRSLFDAIKRLAEGRRPNHEQMRLLKDWFALYFQMRTFVPTSRKDPHLPAVIAILEDAVRRRADFVEGRILAVTCLLYADRSDDARKHLDEASKFLTDRGLNPTPFGLDCCAGWLRFGEPGNVKGFISVLKDKKVVPEEKLTAFQAWLIANYSWQTFRYNDSKDYFEKALRRAEAFVGEPVPATQRLIADAALFYFVAGNPATRDTKRGDMLLERIPKASQFWGARRARAALNAAKAAAAEEKESAELWEAAVNDLEACRQECLPMLDGEIDEQLATYRRRELWFRQRPTPAPKPDGDAFHRRFSRQLTETKTP